MREKPGGYLRKSISGERNSKCRNPEAAVCRETIVAVANGIGTVVGNKERLITKEPEIGTTLKNVAFH